MNEPLSLYLHIPFCKTRCAYCDFVTAAGRLSQISSYVDALCREIELAAKYLHSGNSVGTIYFGGGTPSLLSETQVETILSTIQLNYRVQSDAEITLETNPGDMTDNKYRALRQIGVDRLSLGMQSAHDSELRRMGRRHCFADTVRAVEIARSVGFTNLSLDLIFGYPGQSMNDWLCSLQSALNLEPTHLSLYALSIEDETPLGRSIANGEITKIDDDELADRYDVAVDFLAQNGWNRYEISNWSQSVETESRHNRQYWRLGEYLGFGAGAHGFVQEVRTQNTSDLEDYVMRMNSATESNRIRFPAAIETTPQTKDEQMRDEMIFGLRLLREGVDLNRFAQRYGVDAEAIFAPFIEKHTAAGRLKIIRNGSARTLVLDPRFAFISNSILVDLIEPPATKR